MKYLIHTLYLFTVLISIIDFIRFTLTSADLCRFLHFSALISAKMPVFSELCKQAVDIFTGLPPFSLVTVVILSKLIGEPSAGDTQSPWEMNACSRL